MKSRPLPEETLLKFEALEMLVAARRFVAQGHPVEKVAEAFGISVEALHELSPTGEVPVEAIADFLDVSHQYVAKVCTDAFERIRKLHPELRQELRAA